MPTFIITSKADLSSPITLDDQDIYHLTRVLRSQVGHTFEITNNQGLKALVKIENLQPFKLSLIKTYPADDVFDFTLVLPLIDKKRLEWCIEKLTELNIARVQLIKTARTQPFTFSDTYQHRLNDIAKSAQKQCGRGFPLKIQNPISFDTWLNTAQGSLYFASIQDDTTTQKNLSQSTLPIQLIIGPEGGFTPDEEIQMKNRSVQPIHFGNVILRTETAALVLTSLIKFIKHG